MMVGSQSDIQNTAAIKNVKISLWAQFKEISDWSQKFNIASTVLTFINVLFVCVLKSNI